MISLLFRQSTTYIQINAKATINPYRPIASWKTKTQKYRKSNSGGPKTIAEDASPARVPPSRGSACGETAAMADDGGLQNDPSLDFRMKVARPDPAAAQASPTDRPAHR